MDATQIATWALGIAFFSLIVSACSFVLELRRWFDEGVKLSLSVIADAKLFMPGVKDDNTYLSVSVMNRGSAPTTITHLLFYNYNSGVAQHIPDRLFRQIYRLSLRGPRRLQSWIETLQPETSVANASGRPSQIPFVLDPGHTWLGLVPHNTELHDWIGDSRLYVGIVGSHSDKTFFKRVRRWTPPPNLKSA